LKSKAKTGLHVTLSKNPAISDQNRISFDLLVISSNIVNVPTLSTSNIPTFIIGGKENNEELQKKLLDIKILLR